ncbi:hypothetical protein D3C72_1497160 [compost metagenome]
MLGLVPQQPDDLLCVVIQFYHEVFTAGDQQGVIGWIIGGCVHVEPVHTISDKVAGIIPFLHHIFREYFTEVPLFNYIA